MGCSVFSFLFLTLLLCYRVRYLIAHQYGIISSYFMLFFRNPTDTVRRCLSSLFLDMGANNRWKSVWAQKYSVNIDFHG